MVIVPAELEYLLPLVPHRILGCVAGTSFQGYAITLVRPSDGRSAAELCGKDVEPHLSAAWRVYSCGATKQGTFYVELERTNG